MSSEPQREEFPRMMQAHARVLRTLYASFLELLGQAGRQCGQLANSEDIEDMEAMSW